jgi:hypothetical protein
MMRTRLFHCRSVAYAAASGVLLLILSALSGTRAAQQQSKSGAVASTSAKAGALVDMTGYWVSIVDEDWVWRMMTPAKGDYAAVPLTPAGERVADAWDPVRDQAEGNECKAYGAGNIMRIPERLHITWVDDNTLQVETDAGMQRRMFHFDGTKWQGGKPQLQGYSVATWEKQFQTREGSAPFGGPEPGKGGSLHVVTMHMRPGYLQKNGVPYSGNAVLNEHFTVVNYRGTGYLILSSMVEDPIYLREPYILSSQFKREPDGSKWKPSPCQPLWPISLRAMLGPKGRSKECLANCTDRLE